MIEVLNSLAPVFLVIALGVALRRGGFLREERIQTANQLTYWVGLPCVLFREVAVARVDLADHGDAVLLLVACTALCAAVACAAVWILRTDRRITGTLIQASFRGNLAFVGLPVLAYSFAGREGGHEAALSVAAILLSILVPVYNIGGVLALLVGRHSLGRGALRVILIQLVTNPFIVACVCGAAYAILGPPLPLALDRTLTALGQMALPLALLSVGASLEPERIGGAALRLVLVAAVIKVFVGPVAGYLLAPVFGLDADELLIASVYLACPTAAASLVLADQLGGDRPLAAGSVALSTLLSFVSLWLAVWLA